MVAKKSSTFDVTHKKPAPPNHNLFFRVQTTRLAAPFDTSTRSVTCTRAEKLPCKATCDLAVFLRTAWINPDVKMFKRQPVTMCTINDTLKCFTSLKNINCKQIQFITFIKNNPCLWYALILRPEELLWYQRCFFSEKKNWKCQGQAKESESLE